MKQNCAIFRCNFAGSFARHRPKWCFCDMHLQLKLYKIRVFCYTMNSCNKFNFVVCTITPLCTLIHNPHTNERYTVLCRSLLFLCMFFCSLSLNRHQAEAATATATTTTTIYTLFQLNIYAAYTLRWIFPCDRISEKAASRQFYMCRYSE